MRRIRILVVLVALACTILGGASAAVVSAAGPALHAPVATAFLPIGGGKRWGSTG